MPSINRTTQANQGLAPPLNNPFKYSIATALGVVSVASLGSSFYYAGRFVESAVEAFQSIDNLPVKSRVAVSALGIARAITGIALLGGGFVLSSTSAWMAKKMLKQDQVPPAIDQETPEVEMIEFPSGSQQESSQENSEI